MSGGWTLVGTMDDFEEDRFPFRSGAVHIGLFRIGGEIFALDNLCTHGNAFLSDGVLEGCLVECPLHAGLVDLRSGRAVGAPINRDTRTYDVRIEDDRIFVALPA